MHYRTEHLRSWEGSDRKVANGTRAEGAQGRAGTMANLVWDTLYVK